METNKWYETQDMFKPFVAHAVRIKHCCLNGSTLILLFISVDTKFRKACLQRGVENQCIEFLGPRTSWVHQNQKGEKPKTKQIFKTTCKCFRILVSKNIR